MTPLVPVVDLSSGLVSECPAEATSLDLPPSLGVEVPEATLDGIGMLHFGGSDGLASTALSRALPLSARTVGESFLVRAGAIERNADGWIRYRVCVREP